MITMTSYYWEENGKITVQNWVGGMQGQTHEHTKEEFKKWKKESEEVGIEVINTKDIKRS